MSMALAAGVNEGKERERERERASERKKALFRVYHEQPLPCEKKSVKQTPAIGRERESTRSHFVLFSPLSHPILLMHAILPCRYNPHPFVSVIRFFDEVLIFLFPILSCLFFCVLPNPAWLNLL